MFRFAGVSGLAGEPGFEPRQTESESVVLPLHHSPPKTLISHNFFWKFCNQGQEFCKPGDLQGSYSRVDVRGLAFLVAADLGGKLVAAITDRFEHVSCAADGKFASQAAEQHIN